jgi:transposase
MRRAPRIELSTEEREVLENTVRSSCSAVRDIFRARIVLLAAAGWESRDIATELGTGQDTVSKWRRRYAQQRLGGLTDQPGRGRKRQYADKTVERIVEDTLHSTPEQATHWSTRTMAKHAGTSHTTVQRIWRAHELKPHLLRTFKLSNDKRFVEKLRDVIGLYLNPPEHALVFCVDEKSQIQALDRTQPGLPLKKGRCGTMTHDYKRHGTTTLFAALNVLEGTVIGKCYNRHRHTEYLRFLREIDRQTPTELDIHLIVDNYSTHKHERVKKWLERHPRFHAHFIPTSSSWLNLVERFFRDITDRRIRRGVFRSVRELTKAIYDFLKHHNETPKPFVWTKTADQILDKLSPIYAARK